MSAVEGSLCPTGGLTAAADRGAPAAAGGSGAPAFRSVSAVTGGSSMSASWCALPTVSGSSASATVGGASVSVADGVGTSESGLQDPAASGVQSVPVAVGGSLAPEFRSGSAVPDTMSPSGNMEASSVLVGDLRLIADGDHLFQQQRCDADLSQVIFCLQTGQFCPDKTPGVVGQLMSERSALGLDDSSGLLYIQRGDSQVLVIPRSMVGQCLYEAHDTHCSGHLGIAETLDRQKERFYWPNMSTDTAAYVKSYTKCSERKAPIPAPRASFGKMPVPSRPWEWVAVDILGPCLCLRRATNTSWWLRVPFRSGLRPFHWLIKKLRLSLRYWLTNFSVDMDARLQFILTRGEILSLVSSKRCASIWI